MKTIERDYLKNRLCKAAGLPLVRVMSEQIREHDYMTLFDYMLMRYLAWQKGVDPDDAIDADPMVDFDLRHPFPLTRSVEDRLWRRHRMASIDDYDKRNQGPRAVYAVERGWRGPLKHDEFHTCEATALVWPSAGERRQSAMFRREISVTLRSCIRLRPDPRIDEGDLFGLETLEPLMNALPAGCIEEVWFPELPGTSAWDVSEHFVDYLGCSAIETWARTALSTQ